MKLQEQMDAFKKGFVEQVPEQALEIIARSGEQLQNSGIADQAVNIGETAPDFSHSNTSKTAVSFLINQEQIIRYAEISTDHTIRPEPQDTIRALKALQHKV